MKKHRLALLLWLIAPVLGCGSDTNGPVSAAAHIEILVQPAGGIAGSQLRPQLMLAVRDELGNLVSGEEFIASAALGANPTGATLSGLGALASNGLLTFADLRIDKPGDYTLMVSVTHTSTAAPRLLAPLGPIETATFRIDPSVSWAKSYSGERTRLGADLVRCSAGGYLAAGSDPRYFGPFSVGSDVWLARLADDGAVTWHLGYRHPNSGSGRNDQPVAVAEIPGGGSIIAGSSSQSGVLPALRRETWLLNLDANGVERWQVRFPDSEPVQAVDVLAMPDGHFLLLGTRSPGLVAGGLWIMDVDPGGAIAWQKDYGGQEGRALAPTSDGGFVAIGCHDNDEAWILKLSRSGDVEWSKTYSEGRVRAIQQTSQDGYVLAGWIPRPSSSGTPHGWVLLVDSAGEIVSQNTYRSASSLDSIRVTSGGGYVAAGRSTGQFMGYSSDDAWILGIDDAGAATWSETFGGTLLIPGTGGTLPRPPIASTEYAVAVQEHVSGGFVLCGTYEEIRVLPGQESGSLWILRTNIDGSVPPLGNPAWTNVSPTNAVATTQSITPVDTLATPAPGELLPHVPLLSVESQDP